MEPLALATDLRKLLLWLTLACVGRREDSSCRKQIDWAVSFAQNDRNGRGSLKNGRGFQNSKNSITETPFKKSWICHWDDSVLHFEQWQRPSSSTSRTVSHPACLIQRVGYVLLSCMGNLVKGHHPWQGSQGPGIMGGAFAT